VTLKRRKYSKQPEIDTVKLVIEEVYKQVTEASRNLSIHTGVLRHWKRHFEANSNAAFPGKGTMTPEKEKLQRLRQENKRPRTKRESVKKETVFLVNESE